MKHTLLLATALLASASLRADPVTNLWIGGDQSASTAPNPFAEAANWSQNEAIAINYGNANTVLAVATSGDVAPWVSSASGYYINSPIVIGGAAGPAVTATFSSTRATPASGEPNDDPAAILLSQPFVLLGANTTVRLNRGLAIAFGHNNSGAECFSIDPGATLEGEGVLRFTGDLSGLPARDYDDLELAFGDSNGEKTTALLGDAATGGRVIVTQSGSGGVNGLATLDLAGHDLEAGALILGLKDARPEEGDQSGFGRVVLNGGTLSIAGDIVCRSNPDGVKTDGTPLSQDSSLSGGFAGGTLRLGGSLSGFATKTPSAWTVENVDLVFCGDGALQYFEAMSGNLGDTPTAAIGNYVWKSLTVEAGASVRLVDIADNHRASTGSEAVYVGDLVVAPGATLDLGGLALYYSGSATLDGTVANGTPVHLANAAAMRHYAFPLGTPDDTAGLGYWIGDMAAGDIDGDGIAELFAITVDEKPADDDDCSLYALKFRNGALSNVAGFPVSDKTLDVNGALYNLWYDFCVANVGDGRGPELLYSGDAWARPSAIGLSATPRYLSENGNIRYGKVATLHLDLDGDGVLETVTGSRSMTGNIRVYESRNGTPALRWTGTVPSGNGIVAQLGCADLDGDKHPEVFGIANTGHLAAFHADGTGFIEDIDLSLTPGENVGDLTAADVTGDGVPEFVYAHATQALHVWSQNGTLLFTANIGWTPNGFALGDFNKDGVYEIVYGDRILKGDGTVYATIPLPAGTLLHTTVKPILADFTGDQIPEVVYLGSTIQNTRVGTVLSVYDVAAGETLAGFPVELALNDPFYNEARREWINSWSGNMQHWNGSCLVVADLDGDGRWDIAAPTGVNNTLVNKPALLNIVSTPYVVAPAPGRTMADIGWTSFRHDAACSAAFPLAKDLGTVVLLR